VQGGGALGTVGAYIDLNPIRADMVPDPKDYAWSSYGAAEAGCKLAQAGLQRLTMLAMDDPGAQAKADNSGKPLDVVGSPVRYREKLLLVGVEEGIKADGTPLRKGMSRETAERKLKELEGNPTRKERRAAMGRPALLRQQVRQFSAGVAVGTREFAESIFEYHRQWFDPKRKTGARRMPGVENEAQVYALGTWVGRGIGREPTLPPSKASNADAILPEITVLAVRAELTQLTSL
jgi:hypothetical protein